MVSDLDASTQKFNTTMASLKKAHELLLKINNHNYVLVTHLSAFGAGEGRPWRQGFPTRGEGRHLEEEFVRP